MPEISLLPATPSSDSQPSPLPQLLQTPLGLALIEIQGTLNLPPSAATASQPDETRLQIGRLEFPTLPSLTDASGAEVGAWTKKVYFYVGDRQRLVGKVVKLDKALAVLRRREDAGASGDEGETLEIADVVKWKLHFGGRPEFV